MKKILFALLSGICLSSLIIACKTTNVTPEPSTQDNTQEEPKETQKQETQIVTVLPKLEYQGAGLKIEAESMLLNDFPITESPSASNGKFITLKSAKSKAQVQITFPAGTYECLAKEKAKDNDHAFFSITIDDTKNKVYPSNPPLGIWELTTRIPLYLEFEEETTVLVTLEAYETYKNTGTGMDIDYIQFVKRR